MSFNRGRSQRFLSLQLRKEAQEIPRQSRLILHARINCGLPRMRTAQAPIQAAVPPRRPVDPIVTQATDEVLNNAPDAAPGGRP
jgi:hypothetical protein